MRDKIKLVSSAGTGHYYTTTKNKRTMPDKMEIKKFDPVVRKHVTYKESKIKLSHAFMQVSITLDLIREGFCVMGYPLLWIIEYFPANRLRPPNRP